MDFRDITDSWLRSLMVRFFKRDVSEDFKREVEKRFDICSSCDHIRKKSFSSSRLTVDFCDICKCGFPGIIFSYKKSCPIQKWDSFNRE